MEKKPNAEYKDETHLCIVEYEIDADGIPVGLTCYYNHSEGGICVFDYCDTCNKLQDECSCYDEDD